MNNHQWKRRLYKDAYLQIPDCEPPEEDQEGYGILNRKAFVPEPPVKPIVYKTVVAVAVFAMVAGIAAGTWRKLLTQGYSEPAVPETISLTESTVLSTVIPATTSTFEESQLTVSVTRPPLITENNTQPTDDQPSVTQTTISPPEVRAAVGNMLQQQIVAEFQGWLYYVERDKTNWYLSKMKQDGSGKQTVIKDAVYSVTAVNGSLFYISQNSLVRLSSDGRKTIYAISGDKYVIAGDWIYYVAYTEEQRELLCRTHLETKEKQEIYSFANSYADESYAQRIVSMCVVGETVYYYSYGGMINKINANEGRLGVVAQASGDYIGSWGPTIQTDGEWLYYPDYSDPDLGAEVGYRKIRLDGTQRKMVAETWVQDTPWCLDETYIYFVDYRNRALYKTDKDGTDSQFSQIALLHNYPQSINIYGNWIYLTYDKGPSTPNEERSISLVRLSLSGAENEMLYQNTIL